eukprot:834364-Prorocentrum_lima.AAC.1
MSLMSCWVFIFLLLDGCWDPRWSSAGTEDLRHRILDHLPGVSLHPDVPRCEVLDQGCSLMLTEFRLYEGELSEQ